MQLKRGQLAYEYMLTAHIGWLHCFVACVLVEMGSYVKFAAATALSQGASALLAVCRGRKLWVT